METLSRRVFATFALAAMVSMLQPGASAQDAAAKTSPAILTRAEAGPLMPPSVFYKGQVAPIQLRNSAGVLFAPKTMMLVALVDTSGYASEVQQVYQGYLLTQVRLRIGTHDLVPGAYGIGFVSADRMLVTDLGGNAVLEAHVMHDEVMKRPNPLQILPDTNPGSYRLYLGRSYVVFSSAAAATR